MLLQIAERENQSGGSSEALVTLDEVIQDANATTGDESLLRKVAALQLSGQIRFEQHDYSNAEKDYEAALSTTEHVSSDTTARPEALRALGFFLLKQGRYAEARIRLDEALARIVKIFKRRVDRT